MAMTINLGNKEYTLKTTLGVAVALEQKFKLTLTQIMDKIGTAEIRELVDILKVSAGKDAGEDFATEVLDNLDYTGLMLAVQELLIKLMFSGTPEQNEDKISRLPGDEQTKNAMREMIGLPTLPLTESN